MRDGVLSLEEIVAPLTRDRFLADYWTKRFLHLRGEAGRFASLFSWDELNALLEWQIPSHNIKLFQNGHQLDISRYIDGPAGHMKLNAGGLVASLSQGASLVMDSLHDMAPGVRQLSELFQDEFQTGNIVNLYAGWGKQNAFGLHWDAQEVIILQLSGRKRWRVFAPTRDYPVRDDSEDAPQPTGAPLWEGVLQDGDMLYMPRGFWHIAYPMDEPSLHLNFGIELPNGADFMHWWLRKLMHHPLLRKNLASVGNGAPHHQVAALLKVMEADDDPNDRMAQFLHEWTAYLRARPRVRLPFAPAEQGAPLGMSTKLRLAQREGLFIERDPGGCIARINTMGRKFQFAPQIAAALERLSGRESLSFRELSDAVGDPGQIQVLAEALESLAKAGVILKEGPPA